MQDDRYTSYLTQKEQAILIDKLSPYCEFQNVLKGGLSKSIKTITSYVNSAERKYQEEKPYKWYVTMEYLIIGVIGGYFLPMWCAEGANPNSRTPINDIMNKEFNDVDFSNTLTDVLLTSYNYEQQDAQFYGSWFN